MASSTDWQKYALLACCCACYTSVPNSYPQLQTSIAGVYLSSPSRSSGGRYHNVITLLVYGRLLEGAKKKRTIILLQTHFWKKWYFEGYNSMVLFKDSVAFLLFSSTKLQLQKSNTSIWPRLSKNSLKRDLRDTQVISKPSWCYVHPVFQIIKQFTYHTASHFRKKICFDKKVISW